MIQRIKNTYIRFKLLKKIESLTIKECGVDSEGDAFIRIKDGPVFYGAKTYKKRDLYLYKLLNLKTKSILSEDCIQVARDIVIRYVEGGLQYEGPKKQHFYKVNVGDKVAEMGAYQGYCSLKLAEQVGVDGKVVCIEPNRENFRILKKNKEANQFSQMILVNKGVWHEKMNLRFNMRENDGQSSSVEMEYSNGPSYEIEANTLDSIFDKINIFPKDFMIIQLNGAEINGLRGLTKFKPKNLSIAARYDTESVDAALAIKQFLQEKNYKVKILEEDFVFASIDE